MGERAHDGGGFGKVEGEEAVGVVSDEEGAVSEHEALQGNEGGELDEFVHLFGPGQEAPDGGRGAVGRVNRAVGGDEEIPEHMVAAIGGNGNRAEELTGDEAEGREGGAAFVFGREAGHFGDGGGGGPEGLAGFIEGEAEDAEEFFIFGAVAGDAAIAVAAPDAALMDIAEK